MENERLRQAEESLRHWQERLHLDDWDLRVELTDFKRTGYIQTGDFKVEDSNKVVILISKTPTDKDVDKVVLHEIIHVLLWKVDSFCEQRIGAANRDHYLELLEETVSDLQNRIYLSCKK